MSDETPPGDGPTKGPDRDRDKVLSGLPDRYHGSPWGLVALGLVLSVVGAFAAVNSNAAVGALFIVPGAVLAQVGVIAAGIEYALGRRDQERFFQ